MAESTDTVQSGEGPDPSVDVSKKEAEIQKKLTDATGREAEARLYARLMQDPEFAALQQAKTAGKKVKVVDIDQQRQPSIAEELVPEPTADVDLESMDNKKLLQHFMRENAKLVEKIVDRKLEPLGRQVQGVQASAEQSAREKSKQVLDATRQKYPDFDEHLARIAELNQQHPGLDPTQLYAIAKTEKGSPIVEARHTSSERPGSITTRPPARQTRKKPLAPGMLGLRELIQESASKLKGKGILEGLGEDEVED